ncbi:pilus assembly PilX family protein [Thiobacter aerophilum]|uniref:PilX N-terminal domain-containing pilus assembly protein n=1 Tax=Thiobacter aerophilum TaxID=3121275 RepID=A0ABV0EH39_9BURK
MNSSQQGSSLIMALLFIVAIGVLTMAALNTTTIQERIVGNSRDRNLAFQAAEAALRDAERDIDANVNVATVFSSTCANGLCTYSTTGVPQFATIDWTNAAVTRTYGAFTGATALANVTQQPRYIIEKLPPPPAVVGESVALGIKPQANRSAYRITALGYGARSETRVMLQSTYVRQQ